MKNQSRSNLYALAITFLILFAGLSGCKKSGGGVTDPGEPPVAGPEMTISFESEDTSFLPGEFIGLIVSNAVLEESSYTATIDNSLDVELPLFEDSENNRSLILIIPEIEAGEHSIHFDVLGIDTTLAFTIENYAPIENPGQYVEDFLAESKRILEYQIQAAPSQAVEDTLRNALLEIDEAVASMGQLGDEERQLIARLMKTNLGAYQSSVKRKTTTRIESCEEKMEVIAPDMAVLVTAIASWGYATYIASTVSWTGWGAVASGIFLSASGAAILTKLADTLDRREDLVNACFEPFETWFDETFKAKGSNTVFEHGKSKSFSISSEYDLPQSVYEILGEIKDIYSKVKSFIPDSWIEKTNKLDYKEVRSESPVGFKFKSISDERISGTILEEGDQLAITLEYQKGAILDNENQAFTFDLVKEEYNQSIAVEATLKPLIPIAHNKQVTVARDSTSVIDTLEADYAADFMIESSPSNGTVTLDNVFTGEFTYQVNEGYTGDDSFTFSASNSSGKSEISTINIKITKGEPPVLTNLVKSCTDDGEHIRLEVSFTDLDGPGFDPKGSYSGSPTDQSYSYPVRLQFQTEEGGQWQLSSNGYKANLISGTTEEGIIEVVLYLEGSRYTACRQSDYYNSDPTKFWHKWKLFLRELTDGNSNEIEFDLYYYGHVFG